MERRPGVLLALHGARAAVRWLDGSTYAIPGKPFHDIAMAPGSRFVMVTKRRHGGAVVDIVVERVADPRGVTGRNPTPKMYVRDGRVVRTRKIPAS